ncbi:RHS repeat domain-containing protein [Aquimarina sp. RZ0]|uniref:RHS repeat domain-containing protein n=1 Tax=Aquimarina sp. RZ0 TaxID=2607730 RepID=UPI0011F20708|nr:RHS repeat-associated core domain-containing protein [Aquimarina sp. RZ0]KAA1241009.1 RHS repeat-associated core domain-containing protein [Aquimarina sp. RZ0]
MLDYFSFGMPMPNRNLKGDYRYAYQGQEVDPETGKEAFQLRLWDSRIGRWLTTDPYGQYNSPYLGMGNNPISMIDPDGGYSGWWGAFGGWIAGGFKGSIESNGNAATDSHKFYIDKTGDGSNGIIIDFGNIKGDLLASGKYWRPDGQGKLMHTWSFSQRIPNSFGNIQNKLNNSSGVDAFIGKAIYNTLDDTYVFATSFDLLSPHNDPQRLNGDIVIRGSEEGIQSGLNGMMTLATFGRIKKPTRNMGQFNAQNKGLFTRIIKSSKIKGIILKNMNKFHKYWGQGMKGIMGTVKPVIKTVEGWVNEDEK